LRSAWDDNGERYVETYKRKKFLLEGGFQSKDKRSGYVIVNFSTDGEDNFEAYYMETKDELARLEQFVDGNGKVYSVKDDQDDTDVEISGTSIRLPRRKQLIWKYESSTGT
jgi:hypothetical protein